MPIRPKLPRPPSFDGPYFPGDPIPTAEAIEMNNDTTWALWSDLVATEETSFADTLPLNTPGAMPPPLQASGVLRSKLVAASQVRVTLEAVLLEAGRNNRVCPQPAKWQQLHQLLTDRSPQGAGEQPTSPLIGPAWLATPALAKRMCFRDHVEWAAAHGCIDEVFGFLKRLPEEHWHHLGEWVRST